MSKYRLELKCGGKLLGRWEIGEEPLDLSLSQDDEECLYFRLGTNDRVQKESEKEFRERQTKKSFEHNISPNPILSDFDGPDMETFAPSDKHWNHPNHSNHFSDEDSVSEQDDFTLPLPDYGNDDRNASLDATLPRKRQSIPRKQEQPDPFNSNDIISKDSSLLQRTLPREIYLSEAFRKHLDEDIPAVAEEDNISALDEFHLPSMDENTLEGIPELSEDLLDSSHLINTSMFSSLRQSSSSFEIGKRLIQGRQNQDQSDSLQDSLSQGLETLQDDVSIAGLQDASGIIDNFEKDHDTIEQRFDWDDDFLGNSQFDLDEDEDTLHLNRKLQSGFSDSNVAEKSDPSADFFEEELFESRTNWGYLQKSDEVSSDADVDDQAANHKERDVDDFNINLDTKEQPKRPKRTASEIFSAQQQEVQLNHTSNLSLLTEGPLPEPLGYVPMEVWEFENNSWRMIGELIRGKKTTLLGLTTSHHRDGRISISGISEAEVVLVDEAGNETIYVPDMSEDIPSGTTILFRVDVDRICIRPTDDID